LDLGCRIRRSLHNPDSLAFTKAGRSHLTQGTLRRVSAQK